jgi:RNase P/RNase MRP subunit POP5
MTKAGALRKRYVAFEVKGVDYDERRLKHALYAEALKFFGEYGLSNAAVKLVQYDNTSKKGVLRCERDYLDKVLGFLALVSSLDGSEARLVALKSSGTLKSLESVLAVTH